MNVNQRDDSYNRLDGGDIKRLREIFSAERVSNDPVDLLTYSYDATRKEFPPDAVVWPETAEEICRLLKLACERRIPVYPRGGGTGLSGGALPTKGGIVFTMERMDKILSLDEKNKLVTALPGIKLGDLKEEVKRHGLFYPPDPSSAKTASLGGTLAECAGGLNCVKYGTTKDWVQTVEAVTPSGEIIRAGSRARKDVAGYNLLQLLIGSEGTLAVITEATLRLVPFPRCLATFIALFDSVEKSADSVQKMLYSGIVPSALEFIDRASLEAANRHHTDKDLPSAEALLLIETDGHDETTVMEEARTLADICREEGAREVREAYDEAERTKLWDIRRSLSPAMYAMAPYKTNEDVSVPISEYPAILKEAYEIGRKHDVITLCFGHAGDGNLHVNFMAQKEDDPDVEAAVVELFRAAAARGGSISGEHGIGLTKAPYLSYGTGEREIELMRQIKNLFDPQNILNPGKVVV